MLRGMETPPGIRASSGPGRRASFTGGEGGRHGYVLGHLRDRRRAAGDDRLAAPPPRRRNRPAALPRVRHGPPRLRPLLPPLRPRDDEVIAPRRVTCAAPGFISDRADPGAGAAEVFR